jgi:hypothetical protein
MLLKRIARAGLALALLLLSLPPAPAAATSGGWHSLTGLMPAPVHISSGWKISPNSAYVVFVADREQTGLNELYSVPITGTAPLKLNPPLATGGDVRSFQITPDSQYVIYIADQEVDNREELYRVPIGGGTAVKLSGALAAGGNVVNFRIDPNNQRVVYRADQQTNEVFELYSVPIAGGAFVKLNGSLVAGGDVRDFFQIDPLSNRVVYIADQATDGLNELYSVPIAGGSATKLNPPTASGISLFELNSSVPVLVYSMRPVGSSSQQLYMEAVAGGLNNPPLNFALTDKQNVFGYRISPFGDRVIYNVTTMTSTLGVQLGNLYSVLIGGGASTLLTEAAEPGYGVFGATFSLTSDNQRVVYRYRKNASQTERLQSVSLTGTNRADLFVTNALEGLNTFFVSPNGQWVVYRRSDNRLYALPPSGGSAAFLGTGSTPVITPDSNRVLFVDYHSGVDFDLFSTQIFGGDTRNLSRVGPQAQVVGAPVASPNSQWIVFVVEHWSDQGLVGRELRASDGSEALWRLLLPLVRR